MNTDGRISLKDTVMSAAIKMADGNPGAIVALSKMIATSPIIDPDSAFKGMSPILSLDHLNIYGSKIWILWKDVCGYDPIKTETLFRANQLGIIPDNVIHQAINNGIIPDFEDLLKKVKEQLPRFAVNV